MNALNSFSMFATTTENDKSTGRRPVFCDCPVTIDVHVAQLVVRTCVGAGGDLRVADVTARHYFLYHV